MGAGFFWSEASKELQRCSVVGCSTMQIHGRFSSIVKELWVMLDKNTFKLVCEDCGSLTIRAENYDRADAAAIIECGRCKSPRGTWAALRDLARKPRGNGVKV